MKNISLTYIVDDDPLYNFGAKKLLQISEFSKEASFFLNGELALKDFKKRMTENLPLPDVILLDINMPIMNGWQFLDAMSEITFDHPLQIYVVSSSINQEEIDKANEYGIVTDYVMKPLTLESIKTLKQRILNKMS